MRQKTIKKALQKTDFSDGEQRLPPTCPRTKPPRLTPLRLVAAAASFSASSLLLTLNSNQLQVSGEPPRTPVCLGCRTRRPHRHAVPQMQVVNLIFLLGSRASQLRKVLAPCSHRPAARPRTPGHAPTRPPAHPPARSSAARPH